MNKTIMDKNEEFKALVADMMPIIEGMEKVLREHGVNEMAGLSMRVGGYFSFYHLGTRNKAGRENEKASVVVNFEYSEEI